MPQDTQQSDAMRSHFVLAFLFAGALFCSLLLSKELEYIAAVLAGAGLMCGVVQLISWRKQRWHIVLVVLTALCGLLLLSIVIGWMS
jgi:hypothetical protein